jgi:hypothetical protein
MSARARISTAPSRGRQTAHAARHLRDSAAGEQVHAHAARRLRERDLAADEQHQREQGDRARTPETTGLDVNELQVGA